MSRVHWRNQYKLIDSASKFHNRVRNIFCTDPFFNSLSCYQELAVVDLVPDYLFTSHHFDWYIDEIDTIVELHGAQHYHMSNFGNLGYDQALSNFKKGQQRDSQKKHAALDAGYNYIAIHHKYYPKLDGKLLKRLILNPKEGD